MVRTGLSARTANAANNGTDSNEKKNCHRHAQEDEAERAITKGRSEPGGCKASAARSANDRPNTATDRKCWPGLSDVSPVGAAPFKVSCEEASHPRKETRHSQRLRPQAHVCSSAPACA